MKRKILLVVSVLFGLMFINAGLNKFFNYMPVPENLPEKLMTSFKAIMEIGWLMPLIGFAEILGGVLVIFPRTRALGALVIFPVMIGIILTGIYTDPSGLVIPLVLLLVNLWIIYEERRKYLPMVNERNS